MKGSNGRLTAWSRFLHRNFLTLLLGAYVVAAIAPGAGRLVRGVGCELLLPGHPIRLSVPAAMLGFLLFAAGLAVRRKDLRTIPRGPGALIAGLAASIAVPLAVLAALAPVLTLWPDPAEARDLAVGLAVVAAMPVAGSSAGWSRAAEGNCALSIGLVLLSTLLSPITTPLALEAATQFAPEGAGAELSRMAGAGEAGSFVALWVVVPVLLGLTTRCVIGGGRADAAGPAMKTAAAVVLLGLCYANASACLPAAAVELDWDFLALVGAAAGIACGAAFAAGFGAARVVRADASQRASLVFGVGMANNGAGLALAAGSLAAYPMALLPVVAMNLLQHLAAGLVRGKLTSGTPVVLATG